MDDKFDKQAFKSGKKYGMLRQFLKVDFLIDPRAYIEEIDKVLSGITDYSEINGDICGLLISKDKTKVIDCLADDGMGDWCELRTIDLRKLVDILYKKIESHKK